MYLVGDQLISLGITAVILVIGAAWLIDSYDKWKERKK